MNHDRLPYNAEWHERGVQDAWHTLAAVRPPPGRVLDRDPYWIAKHHGVDDDTATELARLIHADWSGMAILWIERLRDIDGWCCRCTALPRYLTPESVDHMISSRERGLDPFDPDSLRRQAWRAAVDAGASGVTIDLETGDVVGEWSSRGSRPGAAQQN